MIVRPDRNGWLSTVFFSMLMAAVVGLSLWWFFPRPERLRINKQIYTGYYYGFALHGDGLFGRFYFKVVAREANCRWEVECLREGFNKYRAFYPDGTLQAEGEIYVSYAGQPRQPYPDQHHVRNATYYAPNGRLVSRIVNGTGEQMLFFQNGRPRWILKLKNYKRVEHRMWRIDGKLTSHKVY